MKKLLLLFISALLAVSVQAQSSDKPGNWKLIVSDEYPADDIGVATYDVVADFGADPTGVKDSWSIFQTALNKLGENRRGGVLFAPAGRYRITGKLYIPTGDAAWRMETADQRSSHTGNHSDGRQCRGR